MKKFVRALCAVLAVSALCCGLVACGASSTSSTSQNSSSNAESLKASGKYASGTHHAVVEVEGFDPFTIELDAESAPISVDNFCTLAEQGYYDGLKFYRIVEGFCLQGGTIGNSASGNDPNLEPIVGEFTENNQKNKLSEEFKRGTVAMARTGQFDSATSTFFITLATSENVSLSLNGQYAAFGTIDDAGMQVVDQIVNQYLKYANGQSGAINNPKDMPTITSITITD